jgi:uncharacterized protein YcbK (DUF882 family)
LYGDGGDPVQAQGRQVANALMLSWRIGSYSNIPNVVHLDTGPKRTWGF